MTEPQSPSAVSGYQLPSDHSLVLSAVALTLALTPILSEPAQAQALPVPCLSGSCGTAPFVSSGTAGYSTTGTTGVVNQQSDRAILNWQSFNIDTGHSVRFEQPSTSSAALNRIFQLDPSRIQGSLQANGQVYLINSNGVIFGQGAQVNVGTLVASTLDVSDEVFNSLGIAGAINAGDSVVAALPAFSGNSDAAIVVESGAGLQAGERIVLVGAEVTNAGTLRTPDGQTILVGARDKVYVAADKELRGLLVEVETGGTVTNLGEILTDRGNTTLAGLVVNQQGRIQATTSVNVNGSIRLLARDGANPSQFRESQGVRTPVATRTGQLVLGSDSETLVLPDASTQTAVDGQPQLLSSIEAMGLTIDIQPDAVVRAIGGKVALSAVSSPQLPGTSDAARLSVGSGAVIDVSGDDSAVVAMERNQGKLRLFGNELADAPALRDGPLARQEISVDLRKGTSLTDVSRLQGDVKRTVNERLSAGGTVSIVAEGDAILNPGSVIDVSGGQVRYRDGVVNTTKLIADGRIVDISEARPDVAYDGIVGTDTRTLGKWGVRESWAAAGGDFHAGYVEGKDAGGISIDAGALSLSGQLLGQSTRGFWQRDPAVAGVAGLERPYTQVPLGGALQIGVRQTLGFGPSVLFSNSRSLLSWSLADGIPVNQPLVLSTGLFTLDGFNRFSVTSGGEIRLPEDVSIGLADAAEFTLTANRVVVDGDLRARSGRLRFSTQVAGNLPGLLSIGSNSTLDVSGGWINDRPAANGGAAGTSSLHIQGGSISLSSQGDLLLGAGSRLVANAGAHMNAAGKVRTGRAGSISLASSIPNDNRLTRLQLDGSLSAWGFGTGGTLSLRAADIVIGDTAAGSDDQPETLQLESGFFSQGGFSNYQLLADRGSVEVKAGTSLTISPESLVLGDAAALSGSADSVLGIAGHEQLPDYLKGSSAFTATAQRVPLAAAGTGNVSVGEGAKIVVDNGGTISLTADSNLQVAGDLVARGGNVQLSLLAPAAANERGYDATQAIRIAATGLLDASGVAETWIDDAGRRKGEVLAGGSVAINADRGFVLAAEGARVGVAGATATLDVTGRGGVQPLRVDSDAGLLSIETAEGGFFNASVDGRGGGSSSANASLRLTIDGNQRDPEDRVLVTPTLPQLSTSARQIIVGENVVGNYGPGVPLSDSLRGRMYLDQNLLDRAPLDVVDLKAVALSTLGGSSVKAGEIRFSGDVDLEAARRISLDAGVIESGGGHASLRAATVQLGPTSQVLRAGTESPTAGTGTLQVQADHIDLVGHLTLRGFGAADAPAVSLLSNGDIRARGVRFNGSTDFGYAGSLRAAAGMEFAASRIYPATLTDYRISAEGGSADVTFTARGGAIPAPLSALGALSVTARDIHQNGRVYAPFGTLSLDASRELTLGTGSLTSVSGNGLVIPFGVNEFGENWTYPLADATRLLQEAPEKRITLRAPSIDMQEGATLDISGGGDLLTYEFIRGPGGSRDILLGNNPQGAFAILPLQGGQYAAFDPLESGLANLPVDGTVTLAGGNGLPAGTYARLPARYALLPGAYLITPVAGFQDMPTDRPTLLQDGITTVVAGRNGFAGTETKDSRWSGFAVESSAQVRKRAEYSLALASKVFADQGVATPADAGSLVLDARDRIAIDGTLAAAAGQAARGAAVDIVANRLAVVQQRGQSPGDVELVASELANFSAASLMLGGTRATEEDQVAVTTTATSVVVRDGAAVAASELILVARDNLTVETGATLGGAGTRSNSSPAEYAVTGGGALLRLSANDQVEVARNASGAAGAGVLTIQDGATLAASRSLTLEASGTLQSSGAIDAEDASVSFTADRISVGVTAPGASGLMLDAADIAALGASELRLNSRSTIDFGGTVAINVPELRLDAAAIRSAGAAAADVTIDAERVEFRNSGLAAAATPLAALGNLDVTAGSIELGAGGKSLSGFRSVAFNADSEVRFGGEGTLQVSGDLSIGAPVLLSNHGADQQVLVEGSLSTTRIPPGAGTPVTPLVAGSGSRLSLTADSIQHAGRIVLPSGVVQMTATGAGGLAVAAGSVTDVAGRAYQFADKQVFSPGGVIDLRADQGELRIAGGARLDASAAGGEGGALRVAAAGVASIDAAAVLLAQGATSGGEFVLGAGALAGGFGQLNRQLQQGGFTARRDVELASGDIVLAAGEQLNAEEVHLTASGGRVEIAGSITSGTATGGRVALAARDAVQLQAGGRIDVSGSATATDGGTVQLSVSEGTVAVAGAVVTQRAPGAGGSLHVRAPRLGASGIAVDSLGATGVIADRIDVEAVRVYNGSTLDATTLATMSADSASYLANAAQIRAGLGVGGDSRVHLRAGQELRSAGDLFVNGDHDLSGLRFNGEAGVLTLRAAGNLVVNGSLSDGVSQQEIVPGYPREVVTTGDSWSYRLVAGADLDSASSLSTVSNGGDLTLGNGSRVRTGTGDIEIAAGGDLGFAADAAIYTVGSNRGAGGYGAETAEVLLRGDFLENGGDVRVAVRGEVAGSTSSYAADYLPRAAGEYLFYRPGEQLAYASAVDVAKFRQGIGALGGGNVNIRAGGDISALTVALPTNRRPDSATGSTATIAGGGALDMHADGDIRGGNVVLGAGTARIRTLGSLDEASAGRPFVLQLDDAEISLEARTGVTLGAVVSPGMLEPDPAQGLPEFFFFAQPAYAFGYTDRSAIDVTSASGDIRLAADVNAIRNASPDRFYQSTAQLTVYPGTLRAHSLEGDISISDTLNLFPAASGQLELLAGGNVTAGTEVAAVLQSDADRNLLPTAAQPAFALTDLQLQRDLASHAATPVHVADDTPALIVAREGSIGSGTDRQLTLSLSKQARLAAGEDIQNLDLRIQHARLNDVTELVAGRDIIYRTIRTPDGRLRDSLATITVSGPGAVELLAGRNVDFGTSQGLLTRGDLANPALPDRGADIRIWAGIGAGVSTAAFIDKYLVDTQVYRKDLAAYLDRVGAPAAADITERFRALEEPLQRAFLMAVFFSELRQSGVDATTSGDFTRGFDAIKALFPAANYDGDVRSFLSQISTLDGGNISIAAPGGLINAGVSSSGTLTKSSDRLGIIAQRDGAVNAFTDQDVLVNASRVFALDGGDILAWSSRGNIDAGRGARSALLIPPPTVTFDAQGNTVLEFPPAVSGSGIRTAVSTPGRQPGSVYLFAPQGVVNAGDAGIESAGNITVAAERVIGADNISFGGTSVGVPVDTGGLAAGLASVSASASSAGNSATELGGEETAATSETPVADAAMGWLEVFVEGFGEDVCKPDDEECLRRQRQ
jgi:filamentous hemagglutinin family protein